MAILGEFSSGKSRLINALLEEKILSVGLVPVTRSVTRIIHGKKIRVTVKHMDGTTVEVAPDQLKAYTDERKKEEGASEVDEVILEHPSPILKQVEIWDTPGFNSNNQLHDQVASQLMLEADAVLWVIAGHQVGSRSETKLLETVRRAQGKVVGVLNQVDRLENEEAIERQKQEVWTHYGEMVKEVVTTSGKWLEAGKPEGNLQELLAEIEKIGSWSQEQRARKTARRVAAVAARCKAHSKLVKKEASEIRFKIKETERQQRQLMKESMQWWKEAKSHRDRYHTWSPDSSDQFWKINCSTQQPLTDAYKELLTDSYSKDEELSLLQCLAVLEETHWHLAQIQPVPWRDDFLLAWKKGVELQEPPEMIFTHSEPYTRSNHVEILRALTDKQSEVPEILRVTGDCQKISTFKNRLLDGIREITEKEAWIRGLNQDFLDLEQFPQAKVTMLKELHSQPRLKKSAHQRAIRHLLETMGKIKSVYRSNHIEVMAYKQIQKEIERQEKDIEQENRRQRNDFNKLANKLHDANQAYDRLLESEKKLTETREYAKKSQAPILNEIGSYKITINFLQTIIRKNSSGWLHPDAQIINTQLCGKVGTRSIYQCIQKFNQFIEEKKNRSSFSRIGTFLRFNNSPYEDAEQQKKLTHKLTSAIKEEIFKYEKKVRRLNEKNEPWKNRKNSAGNKLKPLPGELRKIRSELEYLREQFENFECDLSNWPEEPILSPYEGDYVERNNLNRMRASLSDAFRKAQSAKKRFEESLGSILREHYGNLGHAR